VDFQPSDFAYLLNFHFGRDCLKKDLESRLSEHITNNYQSDNSGPVVKVAEVLYEPVRHESYVGERRVVKESLYNDYDIVRRVLPMRMPFVESDITIYALELHLTKLL
jgi:hypothetical protein